MLLVASALALVVGISLGLLGGGGAILTTPILVYVAGLDAKEAITGSLLIVGLASALSMVFHARLGNVVFKTGAMFGAAGMAGAFVGGKLAGYLSGGVLLIAFAAMMLVTAMMMLRGRREMSGDGLMHPLKALAVGASVGLISGLLGAGGGFLIVPALVLFGNLDMRRAIGTSLFVITLQSFAGFLGHISHSQVHFGVLLPITAMALLGTVVGVRFAQRVSTNALRRGFAWFVLAMGIFVLAKELPVSITAILAMLVLTIAVLVSRASAQGSTPSASRGAPTRHAA